MKRNNGRFSMTDGEQGEGTRASYEPDDPAASSMARGPEFRPNRHGPLLGETGIFSLAQIQAESADLNERQDASRTTAETTPVPAASVHSHAPSVLIIEDSIDLAELIQATLEHHHFQVTLETHGQAALKRIFQVEPDVILLDIGLPDMTGWTFLETLKESSPQPRKMPQIIVMTAYGDATNRLVGKLQRVHSYLVKPFTTVDVERAVLHALGDRV